MLGISFSSTHQEYAINSTEHGWIMSNPRPEDQFGITKAGEGTANETYTLSHADGTEMVFYGFYDDPVNGIPAAQRGQLKSITRPGGDTILATWDGTQMTENAQLADAGFGISSFAQGPDGEMYALEYKDNGGVYRLAP